MMMSEASVLNWTYDEARQHLQQMGEPGYRARQLFEDLYRRRVVAFSEMLRLPERLRNELASYCGPLALPLMREQESADGQTSKALLALNDGLSIETVLMRQGEAAETRNTVCLSSQVGCSVGCVFCLSGRDGLYRNLTTGEIVAQFLHFARLFNRDRSGRPVDNVVYMGQGEPLLNVQNVARSMEILSAAEGYGLGSRHFTISTSGVVPEIRRLASWAREAGLAVSLHAPDDALRSRLVPLNRRYHIMTLLEACEEYAEITHRRVTYEYALIAGVNDSPAQAGQLAALLRGRLCHVNLIPLNEHAGTELRRSPEAQVRHFARVLADGGIAATLRVERGSDISAACGQLSSSAIPRLADR